MNVHSLAPPPWRALHSRSETLGVSSPYLTLSNAADMAVRCAVQVFFAGVSRFNTLTVKLDVYCWIRA